MTSSAGFDLERMLWPATPAVFFAEYWERRPFILSRQDRDYYQDLCSTAHIDDILAAGGLRYPSIRLLRDGPDLRPETYTLDARSRRFVFTGVVDPARVLAEYQHGATILLQRLENHRPALAALCRSLEAVLYHPVDANAYLTPRGAQGFGAHYDTHDVFILQIAGAKHWRLYNGPIRLPLDSQPHDALRLRSGEPSHELELKAGDLAYLPRGTVHEARTSECASLHVTLGVTPHTWADLFREALQSVAVSDVRFREALPLGFATGDDTRAALRYRFEQLLEVFSKSTRLEDVIDGMAARFVSERPPVVEGRLADLEAVERLGLDTTVGPRPGSMHRITAENDTVTLVYQGGRLSYPARLEPALRYVAVMRAFSVASIPGEVDAVEKLLLVHGLVRAGFLTIVRFDPTDVLGDDAADG